MARGTPKRAGKKARGGGAFPSDNLAQNLRAYRAIRELKQDDLGERMALLGHEWTAGTVGFVERGDRAVSVDELVGLSLCLHLTIGQLLDPTGPDHSRRASLEVGLPEEDGVGTHIPAWDAHAWLRDRVSIGFFHGGMMRLHSELAPELHPRAERLVEQLREKGEAF